MAAAYLEVWAWLRWLCGSFCVTRFVLMKGIWLLSSGMGGWRLRLDKELWDRNMELVSVSFLSRQVFFCVSVTSRGAGTLCVTILDLSGCEV